MHLSSSLFGLGGEHGEGEVVVGAGRVVVVGPPGMLKILYLKSGVHMFFNHTVVFHRGSLDVFF